MGGTLRAGRRVVSAEPSASGRAARTRFLTEKDRTNSIVVSDGEVPSRKEGTSWREGETERAGERGAGREVEAGGPQGAA